MTEYRAEPFGEQVKVLVSGLNGTGTHFIDSYEQSVPFIVQDMWQIPGSKTKPKIQSSVLKRLNYLWFTAHQLVHANALLAQTFSSRFVELCLAEAIGVPAQLSDSLCHHCGSLLIPGETATIRVKRRTRSSARLRSALQRNRKLQKLKGSTGAADGEKTLNSALKSAVDKVKAKDQGLTDVEPPWNEVAIRCHQCDGMMYQKGETRRSHIKRRSKLKKRKIEKRHEQKAEKQAVAAGNSTSKKSSKAAMAQFVLEKLDDLNRQGVQKAVPQGQREVLDALLIRKTSLVDRVETADQGEGFERSSKRAKQSTAEVGNPLDFALTKEGDSAANSQANPLSKKVDVDTQNVSGIAKTAAAATRFSFKDAIAGTGSGGALGKGGRGIATLPSSKPLASKQAAVPLLQASEGAKKRKRGSKSGGNGPSQPPQDSATPKAPSSLQAFLAKLKNS